MRFEDVLDALIGSHVFGVRLVLQSPNPPSASKYIASDSRRVSISCQSRSSKIPPRQGCKGDSLAGSGLPRSKTAFMAWSGGLG